MHVHKTRVSLALCVHELGRIRPLWEDVTTGACAIFYARQAICPVGSRFMLHIYLYCAQEQ